MVQFILFKKVINIIETKHWLFFELKKRFDRERAIGLIPIQLKVMLV